MSRTPNSRRIADGDRVDHHDDRPEHGDDAPDRRAEHERGPVRARPARCSWGSSRRARRGGRPRSPRPTANATGCSSESGTCAASNAGSSRWATVGSPTAPSTSEQTVMPSWLTPITSDMFSIARSVVRAIREPGLGARLDLGTACGDQGELGADEERVAEQQQHRDQERGPAAHDSSRVGAARRRSSSRSVSRSMRSPSMCSTVSATSRSRGSSSSSRSDGRGRRPRRCRRVAGTRPSTCRTRPATVS